MEKIASLLLGINVLYVGTHIFCQPCWLSYSSVCKNKKLFWWLKGMVCDVPP